MLRDRHTSFTKRLLDLFCLFIYLFIHLFIYLFIYLSIYFIIIIIFFFFTKGLVEVVGPSAGDTLLVQWHYDLGPQEIG